MKIKVVIGAGYGDEGKGLMTDYLASITENPLVVRFNGGAQAGHTVETPEGIRHMFSHIGAGTLAGADTYLSEFFIVNPILFNREYDALVAKGVTIPKIFVSSRAIVTTLYDMLLNQIVEDYRGDARHGSCGVGIFETLHRSKQRGLHITVGRLQSTNLLKAIIRDIRIEWMSLRARELEIPESRLNTAQIDLDIVNSWLRDVELFRSRVTVVQDQHNLFDIYNLIFEGAQGLKLDQNAPGFPHLTPSNTGLTNITKMIDPHKHSYDVYYMSRAYVTRHGNGPLFNSEVNHGITVDDPTNIPNQYQGTMRSAPLDIKRLYDTINKDWSQVGYTRDDHQKNIVITHADMVPSNEMIIATDDKSQFNLKGSHYLETLQNQFDYLSFGPTRSTIRKFK